MEPSAQLVVPIMHITGSNNGILRVYSSSNNIRKATRSYLCYISYFVSFTWSSARYSVSNSEASTKKMNPRSRTHERMPGYHSQTSWDCDSSSSLHKLFVKRGPVSSLVLKPGKCGAIPTHRTCLANVRMVSSASVVTAQSTTSFII